MKLQFIRLTPFSSTDKEVGATKDLNEKEQVILKGISGKARPGRILAIMGPSGAGKSTLLDILAFKDKNGKTTGEVTLNGKPTTVNEIRKSTG